MNCSVPNGLEHVLLVCTLLLNMACAQAQTGYAYNGAIPCLGALPAVSAQLDMTNPPAAPFAFQWTVTSPSGVVITNSTNTSLGINFDEVGCWHVILEVNGIVVEDDMCGVRVFQDPTAVMVPVSLTGCVPFTPILNDASIHGSGTNFTYSWNVANSLIFDQHINGQVVINIPGTYSATLSVVDDNGCFHTDTTLIDSIVVSNFPPNSSFTASSLYDCNAPVDIDFVSTSAVTNAPLTYVWTIDGIPIGTNDNLTYTFTGPGTYTVCLEVTDSLGCMDSSCQTVDIFGTPAPSFTIDPAVICAGMTVNFQNTSTPTPIPTVQWDLNGDGTINTTGGNPTFAYMAPGNYDVKLFIIYSDHCQDSITQTVTVAPQIEALFDVDTTWACTLPFTVNIADQSTGVGALNYDWFIVSPPNTGSQTSINLTAGSYTFNSWGQYRLGLTLTNGIGCFDEYIFPTVINIQEPQLAFNLSPSAACVGDVINTNIYQNVSLQPFVNWYWDVGCDNDLSGPLDQVILGNTNGNASFAFPATGTYDVCLVAESVNGCTDSYSASITIAPPITSTFTVSDTTPCGIDTVYFYADDPDPSLTYTWDLGDGQGGGVGPTIAYSYCDTGSFGITLTVSNQGCVTTTFIDSLITVPVPVADFQINTSCTNYFDVTFTNNSIMADTAAIVWAIDTVPMYHGQWEPTHTFGQEGPHTVTLTVYDDSTGCYDEKTRTVKINEPEFDFNINPLTGCPPVAVNITPLNTDCVVEWNVYTEGTDYLSATLGAPGTPWYMTWDVPGTSSWASDTTISWPAVEYNALGSFSISMDLTDVNGCTIDTLLDSIINVNIDPYFARFDTVIDRYCDSIVVCATPELSNLMNHQWGTNNGQSSTAATPCFTFYPPYSQNPGSLITLTAELPGGCSSTVTDAMIFARNTSGCISATDMNPCKMENVVFDASCTLCELAPCTFSWDVNEDGVFGDSVGTTVTMAWPSNGTYTMHVLVTDSLGCTDRDSITVTVHTPETQLLIEDTIIACLSYINLHNITTGPGISSYWEVTGFNDQGPITPYIGNSNSIAFGEPTLGVYNIYVETTNQFGCTDTLRVDDFLGYSGVLGAFMCELDSVDCAPFSISCDAFNVNATNFDYTWNMGDNTAYTTTTLNHVYDTAGTYQVSLTISDPANNCASFWQGDPFTVSQLTFDFLGDTVTCPGDSLLIHIPVLDSVRWDTLLQHITQIGQDQWYLTPLDTTTFSVTGYLGECEAQQTLTLYTHAPPMFSVDPYGPFCINDGPLPWPVVTPAGGSFSLNGSPISTLNSNDLNIGPNTLTYEALDTNGCWHETDIPVIINDTTEIILTDAELCEGAAPMALAGLASHQPASFMVDYGGGLQASSSFDPDSLVVYSGTATDQSVLYEFTNADGCTSMTMGAITVHPLPIADLTVDDVCISDSLSMNDQSYVAADTLVSWNWTIGTFATSTDTNPTGIVAPAGTHDITLVVTSDEGCASSHTDSVTVYPLPVLSNQPYGPFCENEGGIALPTASPVPGHFIWNGSVVTSLNTYLLSNNDVVTFHHTDANGCTDSLPISIVVHDTTTITLGLPEHCMDAAPIDMASASSHGAGVFTTSYDGTTIDTITTFLTDSLIADQFIGEELVVHYTFQNTNGCVSRTSDTLVLHPLPRSDFQVDDICIGDSLVLIDHSTISSGSITDYLWQVVPFYTSSDSAPPPVPVANDGTYTISLTTTSDQNCSHTFTDSVVVHPLPIMIAPPHPPLCENDGIVPLPVASPTPGTYTWNGVGVSALNTALLNNVNTIMFHHTDVNGCTDSIPITVEVNDTTQIDLNLPDACIDASPIELTNASSHGAGLFTSTYGGIVLDTITHFMPDSIPAYPLVSTDFVVSYWYQNAVGCESLTSDTISIHPLPVVSFTASEECEGQFVQFLNTSSIGSGSIIGQLWDITGFGTDGSFEPSNVSFTNYGDYPVTLTDTSDQGCIGFHTDTIHVHPYPLLDLNTNSVCLLEDVVVQNNSTIPQGSINTTIYNWGDSTSSTDTASAVAHDYANWGSYSIAVQVGSYQGCVSYDTLAVQVHPLPQPNMIFNDHCFGTSATVVDSSTIAQGSIATVDWSIPVDGAQYTGSQFDHTFGQYGTFIIQQTVTSDQGCVALDSEMIVVHDVPAPDFTMDDTPLCVFNELELQDASTIGTPYIIDGVQWTISGSIQDGPSSTWTFYNPGPVDVQMTVWSNVGCTAVVDIPSAFTVHPLPVSAFNVHPEELTIVLNEANFVDHSTGAVQWEYYVDDGTWYDIRSPHHVFDDVGVYTILQIVTSEFGCIDSSYQSIEVKSFLQVHVPNTVTFNGDGINDEFHPVLFGDEVDHYEFEIFDRWGELIFSSEDKDEKWNGTLNGHLVPIGVYIWQLKVKGANEGFNEVMQGTVTVLR